MGTWWNDYQNNVLQGHSIFDASPQINTVSDGDGVDMKEAQEGLHAQLHTGPIVDGTIIVKLQESEDDGVSDPYTDIVDFLTGGVAQFATLTSADDNVNRTLNFKRSKRFVRAFATGSGQSSGGQIAVSIHGMRRRVL